MEKAEVKDEGTCKITDLLSDISIDKEKCRLCGKCVSICPKGIYSMGENEIKIGNSELCIGCLVCERACPEKAITINNRKIKKFFLARVCNNNCIMCFEHDVNIKTDYPTEELLKTFDDEIKGTEEMIVLSGAEITTRKDLFQLLKHIRKLNNSARIFLPTNGRMFSYRKYADDFNKLGLGDVKITVSVLGADADAHDRITQVKGSYEQTLKGIKNLLGYGMNVNINVAVQKGNFRKVDELCRDFLKLGVRTVQLALVEPNGKVSGSLKDFIPKMTELMPILQNALELGKGKVKVKNIPNCILGKYHKLKYFDTQNHLKAKAEQCSECRFNNECRGIWKEYIQVYGTDELRPVK